MARIEPFRAVRPKKELAGRVAAPPYDVLSSAEALEMAGDNPFSFLHVGKPEIDLPPGTDLYSDAVYQKGKENFDRLLKEGIVFQERKRCFYVYQQIWGSHTQIGLVAGASCQDYQDNVIKKHELTREDKENDRLRHIETLNAQTGPVFLTYVQRPALDELMAKAMKKNAEYDFVSQEGVRHIFFVVERDDLITAIQREFASIECLYVADGHHRSAAATHLKMKRQAENSSHTGNEEYNFFLAVIFPHNQMNILPYNRVVKDLNGMTVEQFLQQVGDKFVWEQKEKKAPEKTHDFSMFLDHRWYVLTARKGSFSENDPIESLDVAILQKNLLDPILGIKNPRSDKRLDFVGGIRGTPELEKRVEHDGYQVAFSLYPTTIDQLLAAADKGKIMPPKSTWFEPKLKDGLAVHLLDEAFG